MSGDNNMVTAEKLSNGLWVWVCQPPGGAFFQGPKQYKRKSDALKAGLEFSRVF